jgi:hypothetical protein
MPNWKSDLCSQVTVDEIESRVALRSMIWGIDTSPLGDSVAVVASFHPKLVIDYPTSSKERTFIVLASSGFTEELYCSPIVQIKDTESKSATLIYSR